LSNGAAGTYDKYFSKSSTPKLAVFFGVQVFLSGRENLPNKAAVDGGYAPPLTQTAGRFGNRIRTILLKTEMEPQMKGRTFVTNLLLLAILPSSMLSCSPGSGIGNAMSNEEATATLIVEPSPTGQTKNPDHEDDTQIRVESLIVGLWKGEAQWMCGHNDPTWMTTIEFQSDGSFAAQMTAPQTPASSGNGNWILSENRIEIDFANNVWSGTVSNGKMEGTFEGPFGDDRDTCSGNWSLIKQ
jgi:hypothetical protein